MILHGAMLVFGLLLIQAAGFVQCGKLHELLTDEEFYKVFGTTRDNVPEYEVVPIMHDLYKRSSDGLRMQFNAFGKNVDIHLNPSDGVLAGENTPIWLASPGANGKINYRAMTPNFMGRLTRSFVGSSAYASIVVDESSKKPRFEGTVGDTTIVSWPARVQEIPRQKFERSKREVPTPSRTLIATDYHVVIKSGASFNDTTASVTRQVDQIVQDINRSDGERRKRWAGEYVYPSILVVTDYAGTQTTQDESKFRDDIIYQLAFWNSVDLRFRDLEHPKVRIRIAGIVIGQGRAATPYINNVMNGDKFDVYAALRATQAYWIEQASHPDFAIGSYHVVITMTDIKMYNRKNPNYGTIGLAYVGSLCSVTPDFKYAAVGMVTDDGKFTGITTATHELGHILGAGHDVSLTGPCAENLGYIMAPTLSQTLKMNKWSSCSLTRIQQVFERSHTCPERPAESNDPGAPIERTSPGNIRSAETQCVHYGFSWACDPTPSTCKKLQCWYGGIYGFNTNWLCQNAPVGALDGTPCATDAICVRGECQREGLIVL